jgi:hypothetical protein
MRSEHGPEVEQENVPTYDENGVDRSLVRFMLGLTPAERLEYAESSLRLAEAVRREPAR